MTPLHDWIDSKQNLSTGEQKGEVDGFIYFGS